MISKLYEHWYFEHTTADEHHHICCELWYYFVIKICKLLYQLDAKAITSIVCFITELLEYYWCASNIHYTDGYHSEACKVLDMKIMSEENKYLRNESEELRIERLFLIKKNETLRKQINKLEQDVSYERLSIRQKLEDMIYVSYDGQLIWKIENFAEKIRQSKSGEQTSIISPVFYTSPYGYKICARLYISGANKAKGTHMSIEVMLLKGDYDSILQWPFNIPVAVCLFDQTGNGKHIVDSFIPHIESVLSQMLHKENNAEKRIFKFCPLAVFEQPNSIYIRNDIIFLKIMVDFHAKNREIVPCTVAIDPALAMCIQDKVRFEQIRDYVQIGEMLREEIRNNDTKASQLALLDY